MATLLTTRKMSKELASRIEASVRGRRSAPGARMAPRSVSLIRFGMLALCIGAVLWIVLLRQRTRRELEQARSVLIERVERESAGLSRADRTSLERAVSWLERSSGKYEGDFTAAELRSKEAFTKVLARPLVYMRGPLESFRTATGIRESAAASGKDAFVACLLAPPTSRAEKALLARVRNTYAESARTREATERVERLHHALVGVPLLSPAWKEGVFAAKNQRHLAKLGRDFERAPLAPALRAAKARLLLFVMDERADTPGPTELDGERPHLVRVALVDLATDQLLLRLRRRVDPSGLSDAARVEHARGIDSCALALDVHGAVSGSVAVGGP